MEQKVTVPVDKHNQGGKDLEQTKITGGSSIMIDDAPELQVVENSKAEQIRAIFRPMADMLDNVGGIYNTIIKESEEEIMPETAVKARELRLRITKIRINTEKLRKAKKEEHIRAGKAIDGVSNILKWAVADKEEALKKIENYIEIQRRKRLEKLQHVRAVELSEYVNDAHSRDLSSMDIEVWNAFISTKKREREERIAAEKKAEEERAELQKKEKARREAVRIENEKLQKRLVDSEKAEAELKAVEEKEQARQKLAEEKLQAELNKDDEGRLLDLRNDISALKVRYHDKFKSEENEIMFSKIAELLNEISEHLERHERK